jgi:DNA-binding MarR family transcriptional regulator
MDENMATILADVARLMRRSFDDRARSIGVTRAQWQVLTRLRLHEGINQGGLAELLDVEPITLCRMVDRLQEGELVERRADPADRRAWRLFLTPKANAMLEELRPLSFEMIDEALFGINGAEQRALRSMLERIRSNLSRRPTPAPVQGLAANG